MVVTLQSYVTRELLKTFALTAIGLTLTFSLCGGVLNMIQTEVLTAVEVARFLGFVLPVATTLTMPVAALFACAIVYGRLAADNEFDACRASGINIRRLLGPAVALSVLTAGFTFTFSNYVLPRFIERMERMVRQDVQKIAVQALRTRGYIQHGSYVLYAGKSELYSDQADSDVLHIRNAAFLELEGDTLARCGTAREVRVDFWANAEAGEPMVEAVMFDVRAIDLPRRHFYQEHERPFGSIRIPRKVEQEPKWFTLPQLLRYQRHPTELLAVQKNLANLRLLVRDHLLYRYVEHALTTGEKVLRLGDDRYRYEVRAGRVWLDRDDFVPELRQVTVAQWWTDEQGRQRRREYRAEGCAIGVRRGYPDPRDMVILTLRGEASFVDALDPSKPVEHRKIPLEGVAFPEEVIGYEQSISDEELIGYKLLDQAAVRDRASLEGVLPRLRDMDLGDRVEGGRIKMLIDLVDLRHKILGIIHSRLAFSVSVLVTVVLAAALGIIFRGGQLLTAFVISFIPGLLVVVMNIMGRQLMERTDAYTHVAGMVVIWGGIALLAVADAVVLSRYLRR